MGEMSDFSREENKWDPSPDMPVPFGEVDSRAYPNCSLSPHSFVRANEKLVECEGGQMSFGPIILMVYLLLLTSNQAEEQEFVHF